MKLSSFVSSGYMSRSIVSAHPFPHDSLYSCWLFKNIRGKVVTLESYCVGSALSVTVKMSQIQFYASPKNGKFLRCKGKEILYFFHPHQNEKIGFHFEPKF